MNSSVLILLGAFDALIAIIQSERKDLCKSFDPEAAVQTLQKVRSEFVRQMLEATQAQVHASETFRSTVDQLLAGLPQGSDAEAVVRALQLTVITYLPQGPTPPWPSRSSSNTLLELGQTGELSQLIAAIQRIAEQNSAR